MLLLPVPLSELSEDQHFVLPQLPQGVPAPGPAVFGLPMPSLLRGVLEQLSLQPVHGQLRARQWDLHSLPRRMRSVLHL